MKNKGFTLIEILIVISVIGILASIVLVNLGGFRTRGQDARRIADLRSLQSALELYYSANSAYPAALSDLSTVGVSKIPQDPDGTSYNYAVSGDSQKYTLGAVLRNKNDALRDDVDNNDPNLTGVTYSFCGTQGDAEREYCVSL